VLEFDCGLEFDPTRDEELFSALPPFPAICLIEPREQNAEPYLIRTQDLRRRLQRLLGPLDPSSKKLNLRGFARIIHYRVTASKLEQSLAYYQQAKRLFPKKYRAMMRMRPPAVLKVSLRNAYPRCYATRRIAVDAAGAPAGGTYYGPFASRKSADAFAEGVLDLFKVLRCQIKIRRDPAFPGCIYSEMKMCLAPCFGGCSKQEYDVEVQRLVNFLETSGDSLRTAYEAERERASEELDFEKANSFHKKLEKLEEALRGQPELPRRIQDLNAVIFQRASADQTIAVLPVFSGRIAEPFFLSFSQFAGEPRSAEQLLRAQLEDPARADLSGDLSENLWLLARWFYSNPREGEIFFHEKGWPYRKMMRACARLLAPPEQAAPEAASTAKKNAEGEQRKT
jgi:excinuclease UvrABC nuclease subunit